MFLYMLVRREEFIYPSFSRFIAPFLFSSSVVYIVSSLHPIGKNLTGKITFQFPLNTKLGERVSV